MLPVDSIKTMPFNMRVESGEAVDTLAESIRVVGVLEPLVVRPSAAEVGKYEVVCGVRRLRAAEKAGLKAVPCVVREMDDFEAMIAMFTENKERENLSDYELGRWFKLVLEKYPEKFPNQDAVADRFNMSRQLVGFLIAHYEAIEQIKQAVSPNIATRVAMLPERITREVRRAPPDIQPKIVETAVKHELSAREVKDVVDAVTPPSVEELSEEELMRRAQERVQQEREKREKAKKSKEASLIKALAEWYPDPLIKFVLERIGYDATIGVARERTKDFLDVLICSTEARVLEEMWQKS
jgi:ParB family chromosome partitioning protein